MSEKIKLGVIGLGDIAQIVHLPILQTLKERFELTAICDVSKQLVDTIGDQYNIVKRYLTADELVADSELEAVFILNSDEYHAECIIAAVRKGLHVFVEKPMCLNVADAARIIAEKNQAGTQVMVGYMRRYAPAFRQALAEVKAMKHINYARFRDIIGYNHFFIGQTQKVNKFDDIPARLSGEKAAYGKAQVNAALGELAEQHTNTYRWMCGLSSHDFSAMREMLGFPKRVVAATPWSERNFMNVMFEYDGYHVIYEAGFDHQIRFDASIEVFGDQKTIQVNYDSGYIRQLPTTLRIEESVGSSYQDTMIRPTYTDPYTVEINHFYEVIKEGKTLQTTAEDAMEDLKLFQMIIQAVHRSE